MVPPPIQQGSGLKLHEILIASVGALVMVGCVFYTAVSCLNRIPETQRKLEEPSKESAPGGYALPPSTLHKGREVFETTPEELVEYYFGNTVGAVDWLKDKAIRVTGRLSYVTNNEAGGGQAAVVFMTTKRSFMSPSVEYWFDSQFRREIGLLRKDQPVTVEGEFMETDWSGSLKFRGTAIIAR